MYPLPVLSRFLRSKPTSSFTLNLIKKILLNPPQTLVPGGEIVHVEGYSLWGGTELTFVEAAADWATLEPPGREEAFRGSPYIDPSIADMRVLETETKGDHYLFLFLWGSAEY